MFVAVLSTVVQAGETNMPDSVSAEAREVAAEEDDEVDDEEETAAAELASCNSI